jgi:hypothetical protein
MWIVSILYWLQIFICPVLLLGISGLLIGDQQFLFILLAAGIIAGIILAEYIRRNIGLSAFFVRLYSNDQDQKNDNTSDTRH